MSNRTQPSMFHRRLMLIGGVVVAVLLVLFLQLVRLTVVEGGERLRRAEVSLERHTLLPTFRGSILDRRGRKLAVDRPGYAVAVEYRVLDGSWVQAKARAQARKEVGVGAWGKLSRELRAVATEKRTDPWNQRVEQLWDEIGRRGDISREELERRRLQIIEDVEALANRVWERQRRAGERRYGDDANYVFRPSPIREQRQPHVILPTVSDEVAFAFRSLGSELPDMFEVQERRRREYPWRTASVPMQRRTLPAPLASEMPIEITVHGVADHLLGAVGDVRAEDFARRPFRRDDGSIDLGGYRRVDDTAGRRGVEEVYEDRLRGERGRLRRRVDTNDEERRDAVPGQDLELTLDIILQARIQAILSEELGLTTVRAFHKNTALPLGWPLNGAAVVIEVETGEVLAMVTMPTRARGSTIARLDPLRAQIDHPEINRAAEGVYPPGSIIKPLVLVAGISEGVHQLEQPITCTGQYLPNSKRPRCWIYREHWEFATHEDLLAEEALANSCNIYFYTLAERLGLETLTDWYRTFGLGRPLGVGLTAPGGWNGELGGALLSPEEIEAMPFNVKRRTAIAAGIGQGRGVTWTPLQAANVYATLGRGGVALRPTLVRHDRDERRDRNDLALDAASVDAALEGLRRVVVEGGTGHQYHLPDGDVESVIRASGVTVWAKTGTAQAPPLRFTDTNGDGTITSKDEGIRDLDHAWFVGLVAPEGVETPTHAISVLVEYGGSGGRVAGPVASQVIEALQEEGYLPRAPLVDTTPDDAASPDQTARAGDRP